MAVKKKLFSLNEIRKLHYKGQRANKLYNWYMDDWYGSPYSALKSRFFIETSSIIVFILQNSKITPNFLTLTYAFLGAIGGIFLASNNEDLILISLILFFTKNVFDWADGFYARITKRVTDLGALLDNWGAAVGTYSFLGGFGIYLYHKNEEVYFIALTIIIISIKSLDLRKFAYENITHQRNRKKNNNKNKYQLGKISNFLKNFIVHALDERARLVDFICLLIFIDIFYTNLDFLDYIFYLLFLRNLIYFCGTFYVTYYKNILSQFK